MKVIGLTGGIGSGKSTVANVLKEKFHAYLILTDDVARELMEPGGASYQAVVAYFGTQILTESGEIDRKALANIVFADQEKLETLNSLTHPLVMDYVLKKTEEIKKEGRYSCIVVESALLIQAGYIPYCDEVWYVRVPDDIRRTRLKSSRGYSDEKIDAILQKQMSNEEFELHATKIIDNDGECTQIMKKIEKIL
ncbi:dephospho-CoA kinase [Lachnospiraceae bacterium KM106-2]|nr:dephospho-CoA kinase [Lachnospiraceae bacterium KM106-2]